MQKQRYMLDYGYVLRSATISNGAGVRREACRAIRSRAATNLRGPGCSVFSDCVLSRREVLRLPHVEPGAVNQRLGERLMRAILHRERTPEQRVNAARSAG